jgi:hypothetical protein
MSTRRTARLSIVAIVAAIGLAGASCTTPIAGPVPAVNWAFEGDRVTVDNSQDEVCVFICVNTHDEPYLLDVNFMVTIGEPGSASAWRTGSGANEYNDLGAGESHVLVGAERAKATFNGVQPLDLLSALNPANKMDVVGSFTLAMESDLISYDFAADAIADTFEDALNATVAMSSLPTTEAALIDLILDLLFDNIGNAFELLLANIPLFGLGDDVLGGAVYIGIGATGFLGQAIDAILGGYSIPTFNLLGDNQLPPDVQGGGIFTMTGAKGFTQSFNGADGQHTYDFIAGPA